MNDKYLKDCCFNNLILKHYTNREFDNFPLELIHLINIIYDYPIPIRYVPFICKYPGRYIVTQDLYFKDSPEMQNTSDVAITIIATSDVAITIIASDVDLDMNNHALYR